LVAAEQRGAERRRERAETLLSACRRIGMTTAAIATEPFADELTSAGQARVPVAEGVGATAAALLGAAPLLQLLALELALARAIELAAEAVRDGVPVLGLCLGAQVLTEATGGQVRRSEPPEVGWHEVQTRPQARQDPLLTALPASFLAFQWHYYSCHPNDRA